MVAGATSSERKTVRRRSEVTYFKALFAENLLIGGGDTPRNRTIFDTTRAFAWH